MVNHLTCSSVKPIDTHMARRFGYKSVWEVEEVVANYSKADIPLDVIWTDIDYMRGWRDFTLDGKNFPLEEMQARRFSIILRVVLGCWP